MWEQRSLTEAIKGNDGTRGRFYTVNCFFYLQISFIPSLNTASVANFWNLIYIQDNRLWRLTGVWGGDWFCRVHFFLFSWVDERRELTVAFWYCMVTELLAVFWATECFNTSDFTWSSSCMVKCAFMKLILWSYWVAYLPALSAVPHSLPPPPNTS